MFSSCVVLTGYNYSQKAKQLSLGMNKESVIEIMGKNYYIEALYETEEGVMEVVTFCDIDKTRKYTLYFLNNNLKEIQKYIPPCIPQDIYNQDYFRRQNLNTDNRNN